MEKKNRSISKMFCSIMLIIHLEKFAISMDLIAKCKLKTLEIFPSNFLEKYEIYEKIGEV